MPERRARPSSLRRETARIAERVADSPRSRPSMDGMEDQAGGGWKTEGPCPIGRGDGSTIRRRGSAIRIRMGCGTTTIHRSAPVGIGKADGTGDGRRSEQPGPEQGPGPPGCPGRLDSPNSAGWPPRTSSLGRREDRTRSALEVTGPWQPARADLGARRPPTRRSTNAPPAHRETRPWRMARITSPIPTPPERRQQGTIVRGAAHGESFDRQA